MKTNLIVGVFSYLQTDVPMRAELAGFRVEDVRIRPVLMTSLAVALLFSLIFTPTVCYVQKK